MSKIVFDIETYGDIRKRDQLKVTMVSLYNYDTDSYQSYNEHQLTELWPVLEKATLLIGYNSKGFDIPVLNNFYAGDLSVIPHCDILERIKESAGKRYKLDDIAKATLQISKSADGLAALKWYEEGEIEKIREYCEQDVKVTKEVYDFGLKNKMLYYPTLTGEVLPIAVDLEMPTLEEGGVAGQAVGANINLTLPL